MAIMHNMLIAANTLIICGGSLLAGGATNVKQFNANLTTAKDMRLAGQSVFLAINTFLVYCIFDSIRQFRREHPGRPVHPTLYILLATWPLLIVRGLYGILSFRVLFRGIGLYPVGKPKNLALSLRQRPVSEYQIFICKL